MLDTVDGFGGHRDGALGLLVAGMTHVDDVEALSGPDLHLVVDLGDQWADGVDGVAAHLLGTADDLGGRTVGRQHHRRTGGNVVDVVDEHDAEGFEAFHHQLVVDDLVVAVDRFVEGPDHPGQRLDGHLHAGTEAPWLGQQHPLHLMVDTGCLSGRSHAGDPIGGWVAAG